MSDRAGLSCLFEGYAWPWVKRVRLIQYFPDLDNTDHVLLNRASSVNSTLDVGNATSGSVVMLYVLNQTMISGCANATRNVRFHLRWEVPIVDSAIGYRCEIYMLGKSGQERTLNGSLVMRNGQPLGLSGEVPEVSVLVGCVGAIALAGLVFGSWKWIKHKQTATSNLKTEKVGWDMSTLHT
ncbi:t22.5 [Tupaiid betaherpesvirus 1]|uniref:T22.5 n=1 Tax=Tupaiid herpesvirus 1 (strain 1) TaxID=10397 RepID=Q91TT4_TUHV1|nr:t22.5 [Tupaiid betaherpesvirus 1]AAK57053.1 t22.5 [Tupaiid betaherpesvirus 1]